MYHNIQEAFSREFREMAQICVAAPGRINLIGEHTDYNDGFVLPASIDKRIYAAFGRRSDNTIRMRSLNFDEVVEVNLEVIRPSVEFKWINYILGVVAQIRQSGFAVSGFDMIIGGDVPIGGGLASSAAMECAVIYGLNELFGLHISKLDMVRLTQKAEHEFAGVKCGVMDQFASLFGKKERVIRLDCRSLSFEYCRIDLNGFKIALFDTHIKHSLGNSDYNVRREECEEGLSLIRRKYPYVESLRDVSLEQLDEIVLPRSKTLYKRCRYVVEENIRLNLGCLDLGKGHLGLFGKRMFDTHTGLSGLYEVSCMELDALVDIVKGNSAVIGARMMGGGFGGCTVNIISESGLDDVVSLVREEYSRRFNQEPGIHIVNIDEGATVLGGPN